MGQGISLKSERNNPWFKPWFNILLHTQFIVYATVLGQCLEYLGCITFVVRYLKFADFATDVKTNCISQLFLGMLPSVIWELLSTLQKNDWFYGIDDLIAK